MSTTDLLTLGIMILTGGGVAVAAIAWPLRIERKLASAMTRAEHDAICTTRQEEVRNELVRLNTSLEEREKTTREYRDRIFEKLERLSRHIAVLQDRAGLYRFEEDDDERRSPSTR